MYSVERAFFLSGLLFLLPTIVFAQEVSSKQSSDPLQPMSKRIEAHLRKVLSQEKTFESEIKPIIHQARADAVAETYQTGSGAVRGADKHPWLKANPSVGANPASEADFVADSLLMINGVIAPRETWSCFEPQLVAKGFWFSVGDWGSTDIAAQPALAAVCKLSCPLLPWAFFGLDNGYEVIQYWWPEHQVSLNNFGISRLDPTQQSGKGQLFSRTALLAGKRSSEEIEKRELRNNYPLKNFEKLKLPDRSEPRIGQGMWGGFANFDIEDKQFAHGSRTRVSYRTANRRPRSTLGWAIGDRTIYDAFPPPTSEKDILNLWTEFGAAEAFTSVPQLSYSAGARGNLAMTALFGERSDLVQASRDAHPFWQNTGAMAFRAERWPNLFAPLKSLLHLRGGALSPMLREVTYRGGQELFPLVTDVSTFGSPPLASNAIMARRAFYLMGTRDLLFLHPDGERGRMNEYTVSLADRGTEVDKMQLLFPRVNGRLSECFRSQRIPNLIDQTEDPWVQANFPSSLIRYVKQQFGDVTFAYWNKRVACSCRFEGIPTGSWTMNDGDKPYDVIEPALCTYQKTFLPSAFAGQDQNSCINNRDVDYYRGIDDKTL